MPITSRPLKTSARMSSARRSFWVVKGGNQNQTVRDVEVGVRGRQALPVEVDRSRHGQLEDLERTALQSAGLAQAAQVFGKRDVVRVSLVTFCRSYNYIFSGKPRNVVYVAMGVVAPLYRDEAI